MKAAALLLVTVSLAACGDRGPCDPDAPNTICTIAGRDTGATVKEGYAGDGGPAVDATLYLPMDSAVAPGGEVWFIDFNTYVVRAIDKHGVIRTVVGNGQLGDSPASDGLTEIPARQAYNNHTTDMLFADGYLYLAAWHESRVKRVRLSDMEMENFAGRGVREQYDGDGGPALDAAFDLPVGLARDAAGDLIVVDQGNQVVRMVDPQDLVHTIAGRCVADTQVACAPGEQPVACPDNERSYCGGQVSACLDRCGIGFAGDGGPATQARFDLPFAQATDPCGHVTYDRAGDLLVVDTGNNRIRKIDSTGTITTIAGTGTAGYAGDGGPAIAAELDHPVDLAVADDGTIYFSDTYNHCVRAIDPSGNIATVVGRCHFTPSGEGGSFAGDGGPPLDAELNRPYGIDLAGKKLYVSDTYNNRLRVVNLP